MDHPLLPTQQPQSVDQDSEVGKQQDKSPHSSHCFDQLDYSGPL